MDTIFARATAAGKAGVAIIRISGPEAGAALSALGGKRPDARRTSLQRLVDPDGEVIDEALVLAFDAKASFTGDEVIELHLHGSSAVVKDVLGYLSAVPGCRPAKPGEFTMRAMYSGRLDLSQVEGLAELLDAETEAQRKQAQRLFSGALSDEVSHWRRSLIEARALLEATIDFADEDVPTDVSDDVAGILSRVRSGLSTYLSSLSYAERIREGFEVAIVGPPNAGKSTLLNYLAGREAAITSEIAGTTRDVIEVRMDVGGFPVTFLDTAGLRDTADAVEAIGIERAVERARSADIRLFLCEGGGHPDRSMERSGDLCRLGKMDRGADPALGVSGKTGFGVAELIDALVVELAGRAPKVTTSMNERHAQSFRSAAGHLSKAQSLLDLGSEGYDLASEETRLASVALGEVLGIVDIEDIYDEIFSRFCLGK